MVTLRRFDIFLVALEPTQGSEIKKTSPSIIISPNELNDSIRTVIIAPMTTKGRDYPTRVAVKFQGKSGRIVLDQIRTIDKERLLKKLGTITDSEAEAVLEVLQKLFAY